MFSVAFRFSGFSCQSRCARSGVAPRPPPRTTNTVLVCVCTPIHHKRRAHLFELLRPKDVVSSSPPRRILQVGKEMREEKEQILQLQQPRDFVDLPVTDIQILHELSSQTHDDRVVETWGLSSYCHEARIHCADEERETRACRMNSGRVPATEIRSSSERSGGASVTIRRLGSTRLPAERADIDYPTVVSLVAHPTSFGGPVRLCVSAHA